MTPDALGVIRTSLGTYEKLVFSDARKSGRKESHQAYMADALVAMAEASVRGTNALAGSQSKDGPDTKRPRRAKDPKPLIRIRVDLQALVRGHAIAGETCSIPGLGPVPVALARELIGDAILELVVTKGTDVTTVCTSTRHVSKALQVALEERDPVCCVPECEMADPLERDHWQIDYSKDGPTELDNLARLCPWHHDQKTHRGWRLIGPPGQWRFEKTGDAGSPGDSESADTNTAGARQARRREARANDPPFQAPLL